MAITTTIQKKYALQKIFVIALCAVMGVWGVYDYAVKIPRKQRAYDRGQVCLRTKNALEAEPGTEAARTRLTEASESIEAELAQLFEMEADAEPSEAELQEAISAIKERDDENWLMILVLFREGIAEAAQRLPGSTPTQRFALAYEVAKSGVNDTAEVSPPGKFDRATQWMFIGCLPFVPYFLWSYLQTRRKTYRLDDDGTLHTPEGAWAAGEIADIDMSKWMSKSIATVVHTDGSKARLDDYIFRDTHLIVGELASARYPDEWEPDGRRKRADEPEGTVSDEGAAEDEPAEAMAGADGG